VKLVFYSGGHEIENKHIDRLMLRLPHKSNLRMTYIPASSFDDDDFPNFIEHYQKMGVSDFLYFPIDIPFTRSKLQLALKSDIIHLSGGNTFYFLKHLRACGLLTELKKFVTQGGVLTGLSAGAIIMTQSIRTAGYPSFDCDINYDKMKNLSALNLVSFEVFPHYKNSKRYAEAFIAYTKKFSKVLYALPDGSGVIIEGERTTFVGRVYCFYQGRKHTINSGARE
jgi:dipeptidase E